MPLTVCLKPEVPDSEFPQSGYAVETRPNNLFFRELPSDYDTGN